MAEKEFTIADARKFIQFHRWQEAKTYAAFCPHEYHMGFWVKRDWDQENFMAFRGFVNQHGFWSKYGKLDNRPYLIVDDYYYWPLGDSFPNIAFNRAKLDDYIFWRETRLDGSILHCRYRKRNEPIQSRESLWEEIGPSEDGRQGSDNRMQG